MKIFKVDRFLRIFSRFVGFVTVFQGLLVPINVFQGS